MFRGRSYFTSVGLTAAGLSLIAPALAQEVGGLTATFGVSQSIEASDNFDLARPAKPGARAVTGLSFGLVSETRRAQMAFQTAGKFEFGEEQAGFTDPSASLSYLLNARNSRLMAQVNYAETDINALTSVVADTNGDFGLLEELVIGTGTRLSTGASLQFETGLDAPLGFIFDAGYSKRDFRDAVDPDVFESERLTFGITARMRLSAVATLRVGANTEHYEAEDASNTMRDTTRVFAEADYDLREDLRASARLSFDQTDTETLGVTNGFGLLPSRSMETNKGYGGGFAITKTLPNGTIGADFDTRVTADGRRDTVRLTRAVTLPRGSFSLSVGAVKTESSSAQPLVDMRYTQETPRGLLSLGLNQRTSISDEDETLINTRLQAAYNEEINANSSWGLSAVLADTNAVDLDDDSRRLDLGLDYRRDLTRDWDLVANYTYSAAEQSGEAARTSNTVSLSIERSFSFKP